MDRNLRRAYLIELLGTFALVYFSAGVVCVNTMTTPANRDPATATLLATQPGVVGIALAQGLILAALLTVTVPLSGGYLNPAIALMLWVFNRLDHVRVSWLIGAQVLGAVLAGFVLRYTFDAGQAAEPIPGVSPPRPAVLGVARMGTPHLSERAYPHLNSVHTIVAGTGVELVLTFFLVFAIFGSALDGSRPRFTGVPAGLTMTACVLFGYALTGAAVNPARWAGTVFWEAMLPRPPGPSPFADMFVYLAGPVIGALLAGTIYFRLLLPAQEADKVDAAAKPAETAKATSQHVRAKK
jgi:glycerol uptake facilitator-like aquaporin